ncbi:DUF4179 domain-containing protein [Sinanaerobacter sp. ZZT-01]|uniref:DUF4179 domain-containing protein n=1 Tax=Sinanaerobacter sp. ZZT-01 TaxID=3111540 RepID=UPI002D76C737|nr:DUF4179 domain-containing protein [Sinanaerobacter sp. ZZT-01]WRR94585.1 DUF4179 domain-containing protein [Sinanaerobacter sp. ZZT-01]
MNKLTDLIDNWTPDPNKLDEMKDKERDSLEIPPFTESERAALLKKVLTKSNLSIFDTTEEAKEPIQQEIQKNVPSQKTGWNLRWNQKARKRRLFPVILIAILAMATISFAAVTTIIDPVFLTYLKPSYQEQIDALQNSAILLGQESSNNGYTVRARQAIGDKNIVYVLFDLVAEDESVFNLPYYNFSSNNITVENSTPLFPFSFPGGHGMGYFIEQMEDEDPDDNIRTFLLCLNSSKSLLNKKLEIRLEDICIYHSSEPFEETLITGQWNLEIPLDYKDASITTHPMKRISFSGTDKSVFITSLRISPISITITAKGRGVSLYDTAQHAGDSTGDIEITLKDGTKVNHNSSGTNTDGFSFTKDQTFSNIIDLREIESICYMGVELWH